MGETTRVKEVVESVSALDTSYPVLLTLLRLAHQGVAVDWDACQMIGRSYDRDPSEVRRVSEWIESLLASPDDAQINRCVSISCTGNGAQKLWQLIEPELDALNLLSKVHEVHCLARCENGPCLSLGDEVFMGESEGIHHDDRPWREAPFGQDT